MIYIPFLLQGAMPVSMSTLSVFNIALYGAFCLPFCVNFGWKVRRPFKFR